MSIQETIKRHKKGLGFLSSVIVLAGFFGKEGLAERSKENLANAKEALEKTLRRGETAAQAQQADIIVKKLDQTIEIIRGKTHAPEEMALQKTLQDPIQEGNKIGQLLEDIRIAASALPNKKDYERQADEIQNTEAPLFREALRILSNVDRTQADIAKANKIYVQLSLISNEAELLHFGVFKELVTYRDDLEVVNPLTRWVVYLLFIVGWGLGIALGLIGESPQTGHEG